MGRPLTRRRRVHQKELGGTTQLFGAGSKVFGPDQPTRRIYRLDSGRIQLWNGQEVIVDQINPGDFFGEKCLLLPRRSDQIAKTISQVATTSYRRSELLRRVRRDRLFTNQLLRSLASRLDRYEYALRDFVTEHAERRLARLLFRFIPARTASGWIRLPLRGTNAELARMVGMTRWRVSHFLNHFQRLGWLKRHQQELWVRCESLEAFIDSSARNSRFPC